MAKIFINMWRLLRQGPQGRVLELHVPYEHQMYRDHRPHNSALGALNLPAKVGPAEVIPLFAF